MRFRLTAACLVAAVALIPIRSGIAQPLADPSTTAIDGTGDEAAIRAALSSYNAALNGGKTEAVLPLYTPDGIFMAPYTPSFVGQAAVRQAYDAVFKELKFDVRFDIVEVVSMAPTWAFVRTNSAGSTLHHSTGKTTREANQELFILQKGDDGRWRIARYSFSPTNPPAP
ncbi:YybH family protein [Methylobacterium sp.]|uniref:YybH family protein n=1 Tax=Methylobacterium sp. TaxID=409 RepID=UPI003B005D16